MPEREMTHAELAQASAEGFALSREGQRGPMRLRRLVFSRTVDGQTYRQMPRKAGVSKRRSTASAGARPRYPICFASIFGATLKTILDFSGVATDKKAETAGALHEMLQFLEPVSDAIGRVGGADQPHLVNGLATHRVSTKQRKLLAECDSADKNTWLARSGLKDVTMGVTAAVLVAHYVMAATGSDVAEVTANLTRCVELARALLNEWDVSQYNTLSMHKAALGAEIRALERARAAATAAGAVAKATGLDRMTSLQLQLSYMRNAAWPAGVLCTSGNAHDRTVEQLERNEPLQRVTAMPCGMPCIPVLQLLRCAQRRGDGVFHGSGSGSELSSLASSSAGSSVGSIESEDTVLDTLSPYEEEELAMAVQRMRNVTASSL